jgi:hypothetical protein
MQPVSRVIAEGSEGRTETLALLAITAAERRGQKYHQEQEHGDTYGTIVLKSSRPVYAPLAVSRACRRRRN